MLRFHLAFAIDLKIGATTITPAQIADYALHQAVAVQNNKISRRFFRMTGETCTPLQALSNGKENILHILPFCLRVLCAAENAKPHESANIVGAVIGSAHYNSLTRTIPTTSDGTCQTDSYIVSRSDHSGKVAAYTTGKFTVLKYLEIVNMAITFPCIIPALTP